MDDRAKQLAALLNETYRHCGGSGERAGIFAAVAAVLAPIAADVAALKAVRKPVPVHCDSNCASCGHSREDHEGWSGSGYSGCSHEDCECGEFEQSTAPDGGVPARPAAAPPPLVPQPGPTRGAEVAELRSAILSWIDGINPVVVGHIDNLIAAVRAAAFTEAEAAVRSRREGQDRPEARWAIDAAAGEVRALRMREAT